MELPLLPLTSNLSTRHRPSGSAGAGCFRCQMGLEISQCSTLWRNNWEELSGFFKYPQEIRKIIYTTNAIEDFNRQLRKVTKTKLVYPSDEALMKSLCLAVRGLDGSKGWGTILDLLMIYFDGDQLSSILIPLPLQDIASLLQSKYM